jgi:hypothetical protein
MVRVARHRSVPLHFDASPLKSWVDFVGWPTAFALCSAGFISFVRAGSTAAEAAAAFLILIGGSLLVVLFRCRRYEISVSDRLVELRTGPFRRSLPVGCVDAAVAGPASSWRRFFADRELEVTLSVETRTVVVPTRDEDGLRGALLGD